MNKIFYTITLTSFSFVSVFSPMLNGLESQAQTPSNVNSPYSMNFISIGDKDVWQKTFTQTIRYSQSAELQKLVFDTLKASNSINPATLGIAVYLVPTGNVPIASTSKSFSLYLKTAYPAVFKSIKAPTTAADVANSLTPSAFLYPSQISSDMKWGYYVGYLPVIEGKIVTGNQAPNIASSTHVIPDFNFSWIPTGSYNVYLVQGVASYIDQSGVNQSVAFPIEPPFGNYAYIQKMAKAEVGAYVSGGVDFTNPGYNTELFPMPSSATRPIKFSILNNSSMATETDSVITAISQPILVTPAPKPAILVTAPSNLTENDLWHKGAIHKVTWLSNFERSHISNTGVKSYYDISIGTPYGYTYTFPKDTFLTGNTSLITQVSQQIISKFGDNISSSKTIGATLGKYISKDKLKNALVGNINLSEPSAALDSTDLALIKVGLNFIPVVGSVLSLGITVLQDFGVFDPELPYKVSAYFQAIPYNSVTGELSKKRYLMRPYTASALAGLDQYIETGSAMVVVDQLPLGSYVINMWGNWGAPVNIIATSSPFTVLPSDNFGSAITSITISTSTKAGIHLKITGADFTQTGNSLVIDQVDASKLLISHITTVQNLNAIRSFVVNGQKDTISTDIAQLESDKTYKFVVENTFGSSRPFYKIYNPSSQSSVTGSSTMNDPRRSPPVIDASSTYTGIGSTTHATSSDTSVHSGMHANIQITTTYSCPNFYNLFGQTCEGVEIGTNNLPTINKISATPVYSCPTGYTVDVANTTCLSNRL